jgi:hypothetical protein
MRMTNKSEDRNFMIGLLLTARNLLFGEGVLRGCHGVDKDRWEEGVLIERSWIEGRRNPIQVIPE